MLPLSFMAEVEKYKKLTGATNKDICRITGWSERTRQRRFSDPDSITLGEATEIAGYLGMKLSIE